MGIRMIDGISQVESQQVRLQVAFIQPFDGRIIPVDLVAVPRRIDHARQIGCPRFRRLRKWVAATFRRQVALLVPVVPVQQKIPCRDEIGNPHALVPPISARLGHIAAQRNRVLEAWRDREHAQSIAVPERMLEPRGIELELIDAASGVMVDALQQNPVHRCQAGKAARILERRLHRARLPDLVDSRFVHASHHGDSWARGLKVDHIARQKRGVMRFVAPAEQVIEVNLSEQAIAPPQFDATHAAGRRRAPAGEYSVDQGTQRAQRIHSRLACAAQHEDLNAAQLSHGDVQLEILEQTGDGCAHKPFHLLKAQTRHAQASNPRHKYLSVPVDRDPRIQIDLPPGTDLQLIARTEHVVGRDWSASQRGKRGRDLVKELPAVDRHRPAGLVFGKYLELGLGRDRPHDSSRSQNSRDSFFG